jgi:cation:H+ antiporter
MPGSHRGRANRRQDHPEAAHRYAESSTRRVLTYFTAACAVTLVAGVALELSGEALADRAGINGVIFGATVWATTTALPEISSGLAAVRLGDNARAIGDISGQRLPGVPLLGRRPGRGVARAADRRPPE